MRMHRPRRRGFPIYRSSDAPRESSRAVLQWPLPGPKRRRAGIGLGVLLGAEEA